MSERQQVFLRIYSPDFNPNLRAISETKQARRCVGVRSWEGPVTAMDAALSIIAADVGADVTAAGLPPAYPKICGLL